MIYKTIDSKNREIAELKELLNQSKNSRQQTLIKADLRRIQNGYNAEKDNAYYLDFAFKDSPTVTLLHDIRIEHNGRVAQIDHILINRRGIEVLESKSFTGELTIKKDGSLDVKYGQKIETFPNPIEQNKRHSEILIDFIKENMELPANIKLLGIHVNSTVLINPKTTVANGALPKGFERADSFITKWNERVDKMSPLTVFKALTTILTLDRVQEIAEFLVKNHKPKSYDYRKKYPIKKEVKKEIKSKKFFCSKCNDTNLEIRYGKYGYYFKCLSCNGNTSIKLKCSDKSCKPKLQKKRLEFYQVCEMCGTNKLFFTNTYKKSEALAN
jgi:hypothetical protein